MWKGTLFGTGLKTPSWKEALHATSQGTEAHREAHTRADETSKKEGTVAERERSNKWQKGNCYALTPTSCVACHLTRRTEHNVHWKDGEWRLGRGQEMCLDWCWTWGRSCLPKLLIILWMSKFKGFPLGKQRLHRLCQFLKAFCFSRLLTFLYINKEPLEQFHNAFQERLSMLSRQLSTALLTEHCQITF